MRIRPTPLLLVMLASCDPIYGVNRYATVADMPDPARVLPAVRSVPGIDDVQYEVSGRAQGEDSALTFSYRGGKNVHGILQFIELGPHRVQYTQHLGGLGHAPPQSEVDATLPVMLEIESRLEAQAGLANLRRSVVQRCVGVRCP